MLSIEGEGAVTTTDSNVEQAGARSGSRLGLHVYVSPTRKLAGPGDGTFSPVTSTLVAGETDAVLVDSGFITEDVAALGDMIAASGKRLATIFITHGHSDHYFGSALLAARFPGVNVVAAPGVVDYIAQNLDADTKSIRAMMGDSVAAPDLLPSALAGDTIDLEGHRLKVVEVGQGDIAPSTLLHIEELDAVVAGDVAYNQIHQMLALSGPDEWVDWIASVDKIEMLNPKTVIVGHKKPEASDQDVAQILNGTRDYIRDFARGVENAGSPKELISMMAAKYPERGNISTLAFSAHVAMKAKATRL